MEDGTRYPGLRESGAYDGLHEPNCRHSMAPYVHGRARRWSETPDEDQGLDPDELYKATQKQRANERKIRASKREAAALEAEGADATEARLRLGRAQRAQRELLKENPMLRRRADRERAYGAGGKAVQARALSSVQARKRPTAKEVERSSLKPANEALFNSQANYVKRHGGTVIVGDPVWTKRMDEKNVDAISIEKAIIFRERPTTSEVLEEVYHFKQQERGDYGGLSHTEILLRREIDAQNYLLSVTERYNIPENEVALTRANLKDYEQKLEKYLRGRRE